MVYINLIIYFHLILRMFLDKSDSTFKPANKGRGKFVLLALAGAACLLGTVMFSSKPAEFDKEATYEFIEKITNFHEYNLKQVNSLGELIKMGNSTKANSTRAIEMLFTSLQAKTVDMAGKKDSLLNGADALNGNVEFGDKAQNTTVKPEAVATNFADTANFIARIATMFPTEYN